jgi:CHAT domain-containing protein
MSNIQNTQPDIDQSQCKHIHTAFHGSFHIEPDQVWIVVLEVCDECGMVLDKTRLVPTSPSNDTGVLDE